ncbi:MAG: CPBP family intramembrane metalloprotease [Clostridia bacterium]|nr:CPBP family intramembrane metalloprotease [Clostridia bacterium]
MNKNQRIILIGLSAVEIALLLLVTFVKPFQFMGEPMSQLTGILLTRAAGGVLFAYLIYLMSIPVLKPFRMLSGVRWPDLILPCVIVLNNFPFEALIRGEGGLNQPWYVIVVLALECLCIGFFEETAFRGFFMVMMLRKYHADKKQVCLVVLLSSILFGLVHLLNLLEGAGSFLSTIQQVGYSMLVGAMCAVVLLITGNIWYSVLLHGLFDFCGMLLPTAGYGTWFYPITIGITVALAVGTGIYLVIRLIRMDMSHIEKTLFDLDP